MTNEELIAIAASVVRPHKSGDNLMGDVGCALVSAQGKLYTGVCIDTGSGMGFCAEPNAIGSMVTDGEYRVRQIVAVWKDEQGSTYILSPCGRCREFMRQVDPANLETEVILDVDKAVPLAELLPYHAWFHKIEAE
jgi:cytidine deaminase